MNISRQNRINDQENGESISEFIVRLKSASQLCKFGDFLDKEKGENIGKYKLNGQIHSWVEK